MFTPRWAMNTRLRGRAADDPDVEPRDLPQHRHIGVLHQRNGHGNDHGKKE